MEEFNIPEIEERSVSTRYRIPIYFKRANYNVNQTLRVRISNIYDISKFWIVEKEQELNAFHKFITDYYYIHLDKAKLPEEKVKQNLYCIAYVDEAFYRAEIVQVPPQITSQYYMKVLVYFLDFASSKMVPVNHLYYMHQNLFTIPTFTVRACLGGVYPLTATWTSKAVSKFSELVTNKVLLAKILSIDEEGKILYINLKDTEDLMKTDVRQALIKENFATNEYICPSTPINAKYELKVKHLYLFPTFEEIERGIVPSSVKNTELLLETIPRDILFPNYYVYKET